MKDILVVILVMLVCFAAVLSLIKYSTSQTDSACKQHYGNEWVGKYEHYGSNFCVNPNGEVKYLQ